MPQQSELRRGDSFLNKDFGGIGFPGLRYRDFVDNSNLPSVSTRSRNRISVVYQNEATPYNTAHKRVEKKLHTHFQLQNALRTTDSYTLSLYVNRTGEWEKLTSSTIFGKGLTCVTNNCPKVESIPQTYELDFNVDHFDDIVAMSNVTFKLKIFNLSKGQIVSLPELEGDMLSLLRDKKALQFEWVNGPPFTVIDWEATL